MKIEEGKFYRLRTGEKAGPAERRGSISYPWSVRCEDRECTYTEAGQFLQDVASHDLDLVAEWIDDAKPEDFAKAFNEPSTAPPVTKRDVLEKAIEAVADRGLDYGRPEDNFERIANLWTTHLANRYNGSDAVALDAQDVAMMMVLLKVARLENAPDHMDSWVDIAGYGACGGEIGAAARKVVDGVSDL